MPIQVTCPKCLKRFQVSEKFAGKSGPCPACKNVIKVPELDEQVVVHGPTDNSPKDSTGQSVLKPLTREETEVTRRGLLLSITAVVTALAAAVAMRWTGGASVVLQVAGLILLAPPLVWAGYQFAYDSELAPYRGAELRNRVLICSGIFAGMWSVYAFVPSYVMDLSKASEMSFMTLGVVVCVMLIGGAFASVATFELEFFGGLIHASLYFVTVIVLAVIAGVVLAGVDPEPYRRAPNANTNAARSEPEIPLNRARLPVWKMPFRNSRLPTNGLHGTPTPACRTADLSFPPGVPRPATTLSSLRPAEKTPCSPKSPLSTVAVRCSVCRPPWTSRSPNASGA